MNGNSHTLFVVVTNKVHMTTLLTANREADSLKCLNKFDARDGGEFLAHAAIGTERRLTK